SVCGSMPEPWPWHCSRHLKFVAAFKSPDCDLNGNRVAQNFGVGLWAQMRASIRELERLGRGNHSTLSAIRRDELSIPLSKVRQL
ncbi:hypothetical protein, partial [Klebsiella pneumoniae]|uniref:hypothetical protein n=1 Tax=Klebsiella pneumoniae TaxID=573 RepID=UPI003852A684